MKKYKIIISISLFTITVPFLCSSILNYKPNIKNYMDTKVAIVDDISQNKDFVDMFKNSLKEQFGENYKEVLLQNIKSAENAQKVESLFIDKNGETQYPDYVGGLYINKEQNLVIQIVSNPNERKALLKDAKYNEIINIDQNAIIEYVDHSYNELNSINEVIKNYFSKNNNRNISLVANYVDISNNIVVVELENNTVDEIEKFKENVIDSPLIRFIKGTIVPMTANLNPGQQLEDLIVCSVGYRAKYNGSQGYVTAAHCINKDTTGINTGTVINRTNAGKVDAVFIKNYANYTPTNTTNWGNFTLSVNDTYPTVFSGQVIGKVGRTTHYQTGTITNLSWSGYTGNKNETVYHTDFIVASANNDEGDSGGAVFVPTTVGKANVLGITSAGIGTTYLSKASNIKSVLKITRY